MELTVIHKLFWLVCFKPEISTRIRNDIITIMQNMIMPYTVDSAVVAPFLTVQTSK